MPDNSSKEGTQKSCEFAGDKAKGYLLSCPQVLCSFHTAIEFHPVDFIQSTTDKAISVLKREEKLP